MQIKNFHWGHGIFVFYVFFVIAVFTALFASFGVDHALVVDDYYAKDLSYQTRYDKETRSRVADNIHVSHVAGEDHVQITFDSELPIQGTLHWYRPSAKGLDHTMPISSKSMAVSTADLLPGKWKLKIDWKDGSNTYYREVELYL